MFEVAAIEVKSKVFKITLFSRILFGHFKSGPYQQSSPNRNHSLLFFNFSAHLDPLREGARVSLHHFVSHLIQFVPHLGGAAPHLAGGDEGARLGGFGNPILCLKLLLGQTKGIFHLERHKK